jgi:N-acetylneuraminic acid mutarotase
MAMARANLTLTLLPNGKVLAAGGDDGTNAFCIAELYDPATGAWKPTAAMHECRTQHSAVLLTNGALSGRVLVAGGTGGGASGGNTLKSAELYDPQTGQWSQTGSMQTVRFFGHENMVALNDGSAFVVGGVTCLTLTCYTWLNSAETFSPQTGTWTMAAGKKTHAQGAAALMKDGRVLVAGGVAEPSLQNVADAEIFDPTSRTWKATVSMPNDRNGHALTVREHGRVLLSGARPAVGESA